MSNLIQICFEWHIDNSIVFGAGRFAAVEKLIEKSPEKRKWADQS
jgi:hypothetical protein